MFLIIDYWIVHTELKLHRQTALTVKSEKKEQGIEYKTVNKMQVKIKDFKTRGVNKPQRSKLQQVKTLLGAKICII